MRFHYFSTMYPKQSADISKGYSDMSNAMWNAFTSMLGIKRSITNTPQFGDRPEGEGTEDQWHSDEIGIE